MSSGDEEDYEPEADEQTLHPWKLHIAEATEVALWALKVEGLEGSGGLGFRV